MLTKKCQNKLRIIDKVTVKGSNLPLGIESFKC